MSPRSLGAVLALALAAGPARADSIPWSYSWDVTPTAGGLPCDLIATHGGGLGPQVGVAAFTFGLGLPLFAERPLRLTLTLTDLASGVSGRLVFRGGLTHEAPGVPSFRLTGPAWASVVLGADRYTVNLSADPPPGIGTIPEMAFLGWTQTEVTGVRAPEPSGLLLAVLGLPAVAWVRRRRRTRPIG